MKTKKIAAARAGGAAGGGAGARGADVWPKATMQAGLALALTLAAMYQARARAGDTCDFNVTAGTCCPGGVAIGDQPARSTAVQQSAARSAKRNPSVEPSRTTSTRRRATSRSLCHTPKKVTATAATAVRSHPQGRRTSRQPVPAKAPGEVVPRAAGRRRGRQSAPADR